MLSCSAWYRNQRGARTSKLIMILEVLTPRLSDGLTAAALGPFVQLSWRRHRVVTRRPARVPVSAGTARRSRRADVAQCAQ